MPYFDDPQSALLMGMRGAGYPHPRHALRKRLAADRPYMMPEEQPQEAIPPELQAYLSEAAIQSQLQQAKRDARTEGLIGAGAAMLSAPDLMTGMGAAASAFGAPMAAYHREARTLPTEAALSRYDIGGTEEQRGMARAEEGRRGTKFGQELEQFGHEKSQWGVQDESAQVGLDYDKLKLEGQKIENEFAREKFLTGIEAARAATEASLAGADASRAGAEETRGLLPGRRNLLGQQANTEVAQQEYLMGRGRQSGGYDGISQTRAVTDWSSARSRAISDQRNAGAPPEVLEGASLFELIKGTGFLSDPQDIAVYGPRYQHALQVLTDMNAGLNNAQMKQKYAGDADALALIAYDEWVSSSESQ
jgi:hypothetical protein